jgi:hypothetical protein
MAVSAIDQADFRLPPRIRSKPGPEPVDSARFMLAERIADLPFVQTVEDDFGVLPGTVGAFLKLDVTSIRQREPAVLFCRISHSGISVEGLTDAERHDDLEICWGILYRAYHSIINTPVRSATMPRANVVDLPEISRTSLC